jgi:hypothetical protein
MSYGPEIRESDELLQQWLSLFKYMRVEEEANDTSIIDFSEVTLKTEGKNLFDSEKVPGCSLTDKSVAFRGDQIRTKFDTTVLIINSEKSISYPAGTYTVTFHPLSYSNNACVHLYVYCEDKDTLLYDKVVGTVSNDYSMAFTSNENFYLCIGGANGYTSSSQMFYRIQLEKGNKSTDYVPYVDSYTYKPNKDGSVIGIKSYSQTMYVSTDTPNIVINATYNKNINKLLKFKTCGGANKQIATIGDIKNAIGDINSILAYIVDGGVSE